MNPISFISANFMARELGYNQTEGWIQGDIATQTFFTISAKSSCPIILYSTFEPLALMDWAE
jgi:hypothetical protein